MAYARMEHGGGQMPLKCDAEHIVDCFTGKSSNPWPHVGSSHVHERVVRCRDCKRFSLDNSDHDYRSGWWCHRWDTDMVEPDGFCAWGVEKEG